MEYNVEETAKNDYEKVLKYIEFLLTKKEKITRDFLQKHYFKLKKQEFRTLALGTIPLIRQMTCFIPLNSRIIPKIARIMKRFDMSYIDNDFLEFLKFNKDKFYILYFKEKYENESETNINNDKDLDCLFDDNKYINT